MYINMFYLADQRIKQKKGQFHLFFLFYILSQNSVSSCIMRNEGQSKIGGEFKKKSFKVTPLVIQATNLHICFPARKVLTWRIKFIHPADVSSILQNTSSETQSEEPT